MTTPEIQFTSTADGVSIAYATTGEGNPLVMTPGWVSHLELIWTRKLGAFNERLAQSHRLIQFDGRGTGLSDRKVDDISVEARLRDLEAVVEELHLDTFALAGMSQWSPVAMLYASRHPEKVSKLLLYAPFCRGFVGDEGDELAQALLGLIRAEWGVGARATMGFVHPDADREHQEASLAHLSKASSGDIAARLLEESMFNVDVCDVLPAQKTPSLVMHRRRDKAIGWENGRRVASLLPNVKFVPLEGDHHLPEDGDSEAVLRAIEDFLGVETPSTDTQAAAAATSYADAPVTLLFTDIEGSTTLTERLGDAKAQELLRDHNDIVRQALSARGGSEVKHTGDGIMASFPSASGALEAAIAMQRSLAKRNEEQPDEAIHVRIGLNSGEPVREGDDLFGTSVQLARRICDKAVPGQILASNVVRELVAGKGFLFADLGETAMRGFEDPIRVYEVRWSE
ncbi:MAG: adenylate/guanylate cyclase domain-containing protein [Chloroflexi bacterium]|nr:adenylate/guanylate cyclase domain-containing protein [Chloroflexota bacterium]MCI0856846.1 adenylate/guanylate cyclase domain-containing protein [Chloroflexota bacterium]